MFFPHTKQNVCIQLVIQTIESYKCHSNQMQLKASNTHSLQSFIETVQQANVIRKMLSKINKIKKRNQTL